MITPSAEVCYVSPTVWTLLRSVTDCLKPSIDWWRRNYSIMVGRRRMPVK